MDASVDIVLPAVPRAGDDRSVDCSFADRSPGMGTDSVDGSYAFDCFEQSDDSAASGDFKAGFGGNFTERCDTVFLRHDDLLMNVGQGYGMSERLCLLVSRSVSQQSVWRIA